MPIPSVNQRAPRSLYHGLNRLFTVGQELPIYFGPFSSTVEQTVATSFGGDNGMIFKIQPSYSNMETCCVGIDVAIISQFKHEKEILLVNQVIPIQKASTSKVSDDQLFYAMQRGISEEEAHYMIINGFCRGIFQELPFEFAMEAQQLLRVSLEGAVG